MSERKNIERLFQEKFKDFEATPAPEAWENIAAKLEKKENKKRIFPFWLKATGIAASLVLGYFVLDTYSDGTHFNSVEINSKKVVSSEATAKQSLQKENYPKSTTNTLENNSSAPTANKTKEKHTVSNQNNTLVSNETNGLDNKNSNNHPQSNSSSQILVSSENNNKSKSDHITKTRKSTEINTTNQFQQNATNDIVVASTKHKKSSKVTAPPSIVKETGISTSYDENQSQSMVQNDKVKKHKSSIKNGSLIKNSTSFENVNTENQSQSVVQNNKVKKHKSSSKNEVLSKDNMSFENANTENQSQSVVQNNSTVNNNSEVNSIEKNNVIGTNADKNNSLANVTKQNANLSEVIAKDSTKVAVEEENPLEKILKEKELQKNEEKKVVAENNPRWKVKPNVAPLFMNAPEGSPIDAQFADNSKKFENKMSVGLGLDYVLTSKISLRTGINKFDLGYNTNDIAFYADLTSKSNQNNAIKTINLRPEARAMVIEDRKNTSSQEFASQNKENGYINQRMGYVEVPVEVSYKLLDRKFGVQFITGVSTLFLNDNQVSVVSSGLTTVLGEANNLNKVHFSTNIGLGFKYTFWKSFEANFEPTFKYQINTFNDNSGGFKPYLIGLYSGVSFKF